MSARYESSSIRLCLLAVSAILLSFTTVIASPLSEQIPYQGFLKNADGTPVDATKNIQVRVFDASANGNKIWEETFTSVTVNQGVFQVILGETSTNGIKLGNYGSYTATPIFDGTDRYLEVAVWNGSAYEALSPRTKLTSTGFAETAGRLVAEDRSGTYDKWQVRNAAGRLDLYDGTDAATYLTVDGSGNVGIGTTSPGSKLAVEGGGGVHLSIKSTAGRQWKIGDGVGTSNGTFVLYDATAGAQRIAVDSSGKVGIGTTAPAAPLDVAGRIVSTDTTNANNRHLTFAGPSGSSWDFYGGHGGGGYFGISENAGTPAFVIETSSGNFNVGIGTTAPSRKFHVKSSVGGADGFVAMFENTANGGNDTPDGIQIVVAQDSSGADNDFVEFYDNGSAVPPDVLGVIEGQAGDAVNYKTSGSDYAEYFEKLDPTEAIAPGDIVFLVRVPPPEIPA